MTFKKLPNGFHSDYHLSFPPMVCERCHFPTSVSALGMASLLHFTMMIDVKYYLIVILTCIYSVMNAFELLFMSSFGDASVQIF